MRHRRKSLKTDSASSAHPAKAVGRNDIPFDRNIRVVPSDIVLDRGPSPHGKGRFGCRNPSSQRCCLLPNYFGLVHILIRFDVSLFSILLNPF